MKNDETGRRLMHEASVMAKSFHKVGAMDLTTMREIDTLSIPKVEKLSPTKIKKIRVGSGVS